MSTLGEIERAVGIIERHAPSEFIILHCISSYPANRNSLNLNAMSTLRNAFGRPVGVEIGKDGSLLVADDVGNAVWRVAAAGAKPPVEAATTK